MSIYAGNFDSPCAARQITILGQPYFDLKPVTERSGLASSCSKGTASLSRATMKHGALAAGALRLQASSASLSASSTLVASQDLAQTRFRLSAKALCSPFSAKP